MGLYEQNQLSQDALQKLRQGASHSSAAQKIAQRDYAKAQAEADKWERRYKLALKEGREDLVSPALFQKERYQAIANRLKKLVNEQTQQVETIKSSLKSWESKIAEVVAQQNKFDEDILINFEDIDEDLYQLKNQILLPPEKEELSTNKTSSKDILLVAIRKTQDAVNSAVTNKNSIQKDYDQAIQECKDWKTKAQIALENNDDRLAIKAIHSKTVNRKIAIALKTQLQQQESTINLLRENLIALENIKKLIFPSQD